MRLPIIVAVASACIALTACKRNPARNPEKIDGFGVERIMLAERAAANALMATGDAFLAVNTWQGENR